MWSMWRAWSLRICRTPWRMLLYVLLVLHLLECCRGRCAIQPDSSGHVSIPDSVTSIGGYAFFGCSKLVSVSIGNSVASIGNGAFWRCSSLVSVSIPDSVTTIGIGAFKDCSSLVSVSIPDSVTSIGDDAFSNCSSLASVSIPDSVTSIGIYAFFGCSKLVSVSIGNSVASIGNGAFWRCSSLVSVSIPDSVTTIGVYTFVSCIHLTSVTIGASASLTLGLYAFAGNANLANLTIGSSQVAMQTDTFDGCTSLQYIHFNKSVKQITGLPFWFTSKYACTDSGECGCSGGYGNVLDTDAAYFTCSACAAGHWSVLSQEPCSPCGAGTYASRAASLACSLCDKGKYSKVNGSISADDCGNCSAGYFAPSAGSSACLECPPGTHCPTPGAALYTACPAGHFTNSSRRTTCSLCPAGRYQSTEGSAVCVMCPAGTYLDKAGARSSGSCSPCPAGRYGDKVGLDICSVCPRRQYQDQAGETACMECTDLGKVKTNNADSTGCIDDQSLLGNTMLEVMYTDGVALAGTFAITALFAAISAYVQVGREKAPALGQLSRASVALKSLLPGFSFASELFLIFGLLEEAPHLGGTMLSFRLLHAVGGMCLALALYGSDSVAERIGMLMEGVPQLRREVDREYSGSHITAVAGVIVMSVCDVTFVQFLPWKRSAFHSASQGFASLRLMRLCMGLEALQSLVTVVCQLVYLSSSSAASDPTASAQAKALFAMSVTSSLGGLLVGVLLMCLKNELLREVEESQALEESKSTSSGTTNQVSGIGGGEELDMGGIYGGGGDSCSGSGGDVQMSNPMHHRHPDASPSDTGTLSEIMKDIELDEQECVALKKEREEIALRRQEAVRHNEAQRKKVVELEQMIASVLAGTDTDPDPPPPTAAAAADSSVASL